MYDASTAERWASTNDNAPLINPRRNNGPTPRLLTGPQAAEYLGFKSVEVLRSIPVEPIKLSTVGVGRAPRWDRFALDRYLDGLSSEAGVVSPVDDGLVLEAELSVWRAGRGY